MNTILFSKRNTKEILRDPLNLFFGVGFPLILLALLTVVNNALPPGADNPTFATENLAPGLSWFGTAFMALFGGMLLAKDRTSSFLMRLFASPMTAVDFILGYTLPLLVMVILQSAMTFLASAATGFELTPTVLVAIIVTMLTSLFFIGLGLLCGCVMSDKAVGGVCGALVINVAGWLSGVFIPIDLIGGSFQTVSHLLPFYHSVEAVKESLNGNWGSMSSHLAIVLAYVVVIFVLAIFAFQRKMRSGER